MSTKVGLVVPSGDRVHANFAMALAFVTHFSRDISFVFINPKGSNVAKQRHVGVEAAIGSGCEYIFFLDSDLTFPPNTLMALLAHKKDIVGAGYARRVPPHNNLIEAMPAALVIAPPTEAPPPAGLVEVLALPGGVMLIRASVFDMLKPPYYRWACLEDGESLGLYSGPAMPGEDQVFCLRARGAGFRIWADLKLSKQIIHWGEQGTILLDATKPDSFDLVELE